MNSTLALLKERLQTALVAAFGPDLADADPVLVPASNPKFGDYQANGAMGLAKRLGMAPRAIASQLLDHLDVSDLCDPPEVAGPGFINLRLKPEYLEAQLKAIQADPRLGVAPVANPKRVIVDYPSPNIAKEMHVGHLRPCVIGDALARILEFLGHDVLQLSHIGDWGTPFGMLIAYLREAYPDALAGSELDLGNLATFYQAAKKRFDEDTDFQEAARLAVIKLQAGDPETIQAWKVVCDLSNRTNRKIFDLMGLSPKIQERGESFYNPLLPDVIAELDRLGLLVEDQGAKCVFLEGFTNKEGKPLPLIVQKSDGGYNYAATDLAAIRYRVTEDRAQRVIYPVGAEQINHFAQIFQVGKRAGWITDETEFVHAALGNVLGEDGKKLKSRSGEAARLVDFLEEAIARARADLEARLTEENRTESEDFIAHVANVVGIGAIKYADLSQNRTSGYIFSYDKMLALQGNTAPYMLYAYVRVQGISRKGGIDFEALGDNSRVVLQDEAEFALAKSLLQFDEVLSAVEADLLPNRLCEYLFDLSKTFNQFYDRCPILQAEDPQRTSRLILADLTARTIKLGLSLLGIQVLERM
ncbi:arginine--tRNA ligase [Thermoleptolyngbya oregonensis NK1-22]|uniref:Arginine--tRNA ligase n=1 Tax=Thermoleptolyngbya oregonensis NK1-22 TaxID=2547457 RepID=A0AA96YR48_9CYAN|nr:arginine--tRNA ligase [Thermoleptolyngbya oregonensis]WOB44887.1 arginine--tRNA ligase [Thermoleptolyngbya oregonensis NK1-22]